MRGSGKYLLSKKYTHKRNQKQSKSNMMKLVFKDFENPSVPHTIEPFCYDPNNYIKMNIQEKPLNSYPQDIIQAIKLLSFTENKTATPFGSYIYRTQKYPSDVDLIEQFSDCCSIGDVITKFEVALKKVVEEIINTDDYYYSEVKAGIDKRYDVNIGKMSHGIFIPNPKLAQIAQDMYSQNLFTETEYNIIQLILSKRHLEARGYDAITYIFRERKILRWTPEETLKGEKVLPLGIKISLKTALTHKSAVKIDMIMKHGGRLIEITNFVALYYEDKGKLYFINSNLLDANNINVQLPQEIEKLYFSDMFYSPFKMVKRMYSLARHNRDCRVLRKIIPFISSNASLLYQVKSEIDTILLVMDRYTKYPTDFINTQVENFKPRIASVVEIPQDDLFNLNELITDITTTKQKKQKMEKLKELKEYIVEFINILTITYLNKVKLNPPPIQYLPPEPKYDISTVRDVSENPTNPFI
jgi:hypothetical protein